MRRVLFAVVSTVASLAGLLSFKTHSASLATPPAISATAPATSGDTSSAGTGTSGTSSSGTTSGGTASGGTSSSSAPASGSGSSSATTTTKTVTGDSVDTRWGPVQVKITVTGNTLTAVSAIVYPTENPRDQEINSYAIPALTKEALSAGNASIVMISGATYTSQGYIGSLQSALDKAGL